MEIIHRKLITESRNSTSLLCKQYCDPEINKSGGYCISICLDFCRDICLYPLSSLVDEDERKKSNKSNTFLVVASSLVVVTFFLVGMYVFYVKYYSKRTRSSDSSQTQQRQPLSEDTHDHEVFIDEDHGPELDHPIWYIRTVGLQQSIISSITMCQYKGGDGLVEGTECSVCLSEFQEDETLRLLPKCNHAFHVPCIDTWLRSHTNCPMCRAPIVTTVATPAPEPNVVVNSSPDEETQVEIFENIEASSGGIENEVCETGIETEDNRESSGKQRDETLIEEVNGVVKPRRSVSMDSLAASKICLQLSDRNSNTQLVAVNKLNRGIVPNRNSGNQKFQRQRSSKGSSSKGRSLQSGPQNMKRSSSCNGKFLICRDIQTSDSVFPLKSF